MKLQLSSSLVPSAVWCTFLSILPIDAKKQRLRGLSGNELPSDVFSMPMSMPLSEDEVVMGIAGKVYGGGGGGGGYIICTQGGLKHIEYLENKLDNLRKDCNGHSSFHCSVIVSHTIKLLESYLAKLHQARINGGCSPTQSPRSPTQSPTGQPTADPTQSPTKQPTVDTSEECRPLSNPIHSCNSTLIRNPQGFITLEIDSLAGFEDNHAYSLWLKTDPADLGKVRQTYNIGGFVPSLAASPLAYTIPDATYQGSNPSFILYDYEDKCGIIEPLPSGCTTGEECSLDLDPVIDKAYGLDNAMTDLIRIYFKDHGDYNSTQYTPGGNADQLRTFNGGCGLGTIMNPKTGCPHDDSVAAPYCQDVAYIDFSGEPCDPCNPYGGCYFPTDPSCY